jgi:hypothetical protein
MSEKPYGIGIEPFSNPWKKAEKVGKSQAAAALANCSGVMP